MADHLDKLTQATLSHKQMREAMSQRSLELAAEAEDRREQLAAQLAQPDPLGGADDGTGQVAGGQA